MKPTFETALHRTIREQRLKDQAAARLGQVVGGKAARILSNNLTRSERIERRAKATGLYQDTASHAHPDHILGE